ncbi:hypothetical protein ACJX0J_028356, partial [Zea mays]
FLWRCIGFGYWFVSTSEFLVRKEENMYCQTHILFVSGVLLTIGSKPTVQFFTKPKDHKGSIFFGFGFFLVLIGWPALGIMVDSYGFIMLFKVCGCLLFRFSSAVIGWYTTTRT